MWRRKKYKKKVKWGRVCSVSNSRCTPLRFINAAAFTIIFNVPPHPSSLPPYECAVCLWGFYKFKWHLKARRGRTFTRKVLRRHGSACCLNNRRHRRLRHCRFHSSVNSTCCQEAAFIRVEFGTSRTARATVDQILSEMLGLHPTCFINGIGSFTRYCLLI